jgi:hypothetical protein
MFYLSQQLEPSSGWAQHAPALSSFVSLGVQQTATFSLGVQHEEATGSAVFLEVIVLFRITGISEYFVSMVLVF